jgi:hypothetical protein
LGVRGGPGGPFGRSVPPKPDGEPGYAPVPRPGGTGKAGPRARDPNLRGTGYGGKGGKPFKNG